MSSVEAYLSLHRSMGYKFTEHESVLRAFSRHLAERGHEHVRADVALEWIRRNPSPRQRCEWLRIVRGLAIYLHLEDPLHEVPPAGVFPFRRQRPRPFIYTPDQVSRVVKLIGERHRPRWHGPTYGTLLGLIAATGMRVSEALALRLGDVTDDGLVVRETKFRKSRLLPLHETTRAALERYLVLRRGMVAATDHLFVTSRGTRVISAVIQQKFNRIRQAAGLIQPLGKRNPRIHDLRHTFAMRALEKACFERDRVTEHILALSTYLGHACVTHTYWYLEATPELMAQIAERCEGHAEGERP